MFVVHWNYLLRGIQLINAFFSVFCCIRKTSNYLLLQGSSNLIMIHMEMFLNKVVCITEQIHAKKSV